MKKYIALVMIFMMLSPTFLVLPVALASPLTTNLIDDGDFAEWPGSWTYSKSKDLSIARSTFGNPDNSLWVFASFQASGLQTLVLSQQIGIISGTYDTAILLVDYYASQGAVWDFEWYFEISCGSDTYTSPIFSAEWVLSWQTSTDSSNELITFLNNHAGKQAIFEFNIRIFPDATNREIYFDNIKLEASLTEKKYVVEIEISRFYIKKDFDPLLRPGAADPNFAINILDYDDDFNPSTDPNDDWFKAPIDQDWWKIIFIGGNDIDVGDDELFESFAGPIYIPKAKLTLPIIIKIRVWDDDFAGIADEIISTSLTVGTLPSTFNIENDGAFLEINVRELSVRPLTRTYPISGTENLWYFYEVKADVVRKVYNPNQFEPVRVAIIDTGIDTSKEQLSEKLVFWRDLANDKTVAYDDEGHGTEVAALIAGKTGGIAQNAELVVIKVFPNPDIDRLVNAINIAVSQKAKIISMSLGVTERALGGASSEDVTKLKNAINEAYSKGVVIVAAAGNSRTCLETYPAHLDNVISVSALLRFDPSKGYSSLGDMVTQVPSDDTYLIFADIFSNYGTDCYNARSSIEISAPGCGIKDFDGRNDICGYEDRDYTAGTSFAAPIVSGVAALIIGYAKKAYGVDLTPDQVRRILRASAVDLGPLGWDPYYGYGMVNAYAALKKVDEMFKPTNVDVVLLIDRSGSMGWPISKIEDAKTAAKQFVDLMKIGDKVGVVSFESAVRVEYPLTEIISSETKTSVKAKIDQIYPMGMTAMGDGLRKAYQQLVDHGNPSHPWAIVLMSNGWHNYGTEHPYDVIPDLKSKNIRVYTIGLGAGADSNLLGRIASETGGFYRFAPTSNELLEIYNDIAAAIAQSQTLISSSQSISEGETVSMEVNLDSSITQATFTISWGGSDLDLILIDPSGAIIDENTAATNPDIDYVEETRYEMFRIRYPLPGTWTMQIIGVNIPLGCESFIAQVTAATNIILSLHTDKDSYTFPERVKISASLSDWGIPLTGVNVIADVVRPDHSLVTIPLYDDGSDLHGDDEANDGVYCNYFNQYTEDGAYTIHVFAEGQTLTGEPFTREMEKTILISGIPRDVTPPETTMFIGSPQYFDTKGQMYITSSTPITLTAVDNHGAGSGVALTSYRVYNATFSTGWVTYTGPFHLVNLNDGPYSIDYNSTDNAGNVETTKTQVVILDNSPPSIQILNPPIGWALQDGVNFTISSEDLCGTRFLNFSIREADGDQGIPVGFEDISATYNETSGKWELFFDTLQLPDGFYIVLVSAEDNLGHVSTISVPYSIRNWAVLELLPASKSNKAGRTMPVKFALRVAASVDPNQPFVYNEELAIKIYAADDPDNILQTSTFGDTARDYRINTIDEHYITNFKTLKKPKTYTVEVWRKKMLIGSFQFETNK